MCVLIFLLPLVSKRTALKWRIYQYSSSSTVNILPSPSGQERRRWRWWWSSGAFFLFSRAAETLDTNKILVWKDFFFKKFLFSCVYATGGMCQNYHHHSSPSSKTWKWTKKIVIFYAHLEISGRKAGNAMPKGRLLHSVWEYITRIKCMCVCDTLNLLKLSTYNKLLKLAYIFSFFHL